MSTGWEERLSDLPSRTCDGIVVYEATTFRARGRGLSKMEPMPEDVALHIARTSAVHTVGMRFALDLVWLDRRGEVVRVDHDVGRWRNRMCLRARSVVEARAGQGERVAAALSGSGSSR